MDRSGATAGSSSVIHDAIGGCFQLTRLSAAWRRNTRDKGPGRIVTRKEAGYSFPRQRSRTKHSCGDGQCGACTALIDGGAAKSCVVSAASATGRKIVTTAGLASGKGLHPGRRFSRSRRRISMRLLQAGMILGAVALLRQDASPTVGVIREGLQGHVCRGGAYPHSVDAVRARQGSRSRPGSRG